jgi:hypothetical protein
MPRSVGKRKQSRWRLFPAGALGLSAGLAGTMWLGMADWQRQDLLFRLGWQGSQMLSASSAPTADSPNLYFADCTAAHDAGHYNIPRGAPGYRQALDADLDGLACEPLSGSKRRRWWQFW